MTIIERKSKIRVQALLKLVEKGEYSVEYALVKLDELNEKGYLTGSDYEETFDKIAEMLQKDEQEVIETVDENIVNTDETTEDNTFVEEVVENTEVVEEVVESEEV